MRQILLATLLLIGTAVGNGPRADWQYTRWGMTPDEVIEASRGQAVRPDSTFIARNSPDGYVAALVAPYKAGDFLFEAVFQFREQDHRLAMVDLNLRNHEIRLQLHNALEGLYGKPMDDTGYSSGTRLQR